MGNILVIFKKELKSYFASPIAYLLLGIFAVIFGFFFYSATRVFVLTGMQMQMMGRGMPMDVNEYVIRPLLGNASVIGLFLIPETLRATTWGAKGPGARVNVEAETNGPTLTISLVVRSVLPAVGVTDG